MPVSAETSLANPRLWTPSFGGMCSATLLLFTSYHLLTPTLPLFLSQKVSDALAVGTLISAFLVASLIVRPFAGALIDAMPSRRLVIGSLAGFALASAAYPFAQDFMLLLTLRLFQGACYAMFYTGVASQISRGAPAHRKAEGMAWFGNAIKVAMALAPALGLFITTQWHPLAPFALSSAAAVFALAVFWRTPLSSLTTAPQGRRLPLTRLAGTLIEPHAIFPGAVMASATLLFGAMMAYAPFLVAEKGLTSQGWFYAVFSVSLIASRSVIGPLADRFGRAAVALPGVTLTILAVALLAVSSHSAGFLAATALYGMAAGTVQPALMAMAADRAGNQRQGAAMATFTLFNDLGIAAGSFLMPVWGGLWGYGHALLALCGLSSLGWLALTIFVGMSMLKPQREAAAS